MLAPDGAEAPARVIRIASAAHRKRRVGKREAAVNAAKFTTTRTPPQPALGPGFIGISNSLILEHNSPHIAFR